MRAATSHGKVQKRCWNSGINLCQLVSISYSPTISSNYLFIISEIILAIKNKVVSPSKNRDELFKRYIVFHR